MISMMLQFSSFLRFKGITVPTSSLLNAIEATRHINPIDPQQFYFALQGCLVAKPEDRSTFRELFDRFFKDKTPLEFEQVDSSIKLQIDEFAKRIRMEGGIPNRVLADYLEGDVTQLLHMLNDERGSRLRHSEEFHRLQKAKEQNRQKIVQKVSVLNDKIADFTAASYHLTREHRRVLGEYLKEQLQTAADLAKEKGRKRSIHGNLMPWEKQRTLSTISFDKLTIKEHEKIKEAVEKLAQKLKDALTRKRKRARKGHIDIKGTIRSSMRYGGTPFDIKRRIPTRKKGKIVAICDISMSVAYAAHLMLLLLYRLQYRFTRIRSFIFVRSTYEISHYFREHSLENGLEKAVKQHHIGLGQLTNYGIAFKTFLENYASSLTKDTTLIILGDGQNNQNDPKVEYLKRMSEKVARTIWLNPEEEMYWYTRTNIILQYKPYCDELVECATLEQLSEFVRNLVI